jgi:hypothetical protein
VVPSRATTAVASPEQLATIGVQAPAVQPKPEAQSALVVHVVLQAALAVSQR